MNGLRLRRSPAKGSAAQEQEARRSGSGSSRYAPTRGAPVQAGDFARFDGRGRGADCGDEPQEEAVILEIRTYRLKPGTRDEFMRVMREESLPLLLKHGLDVVDAGASLVAEDDAEEAYLIRAFASIDEREKQEAWFYGSDEWRGGPREAIVSRIESYHTIVIDASAEAVRALRRVGNG